MPRARLGGSGINRSAITAAYDSITPTCEGTRQGHRRPRSRRTLRTHARSPETVAHTHRHGRLTPDVLNDPETVSELANAALRRNRRLRRLSAEIRRRQEKLHAVCTRRAWAAYLNVEEATNARLAEVVQLVAQWAFAEACRGVDSGTTDENK